MGRSIGPKRHSLNHQNICIQIVATGHRSPGAVSDGIAGCYTGGEHTGMAVMGRLKDFALGLVLAAMGVAAFFQVFHVDPVWRFASIGALSAISILAAAVFFVFAFSPRE